MGDREEQIKRTLRETAAQLKLIVDHAPAMIAYLDRELRYRYANRPYMAFYAPEAQSLDGRALADVLGTDA
jgi:PAS domain-containing protein